MTTPEAFYDRYATTRVKMNVIVTADKKEQCLICSKNKQQYKFNSCKCAGGICADCVRNGKGGLRCPTCKRVSVSISPKK